MMIVRLVVRATRAITCARTGGRALTMKLPLLWCSARGKLETFSVSSRLICYRAHGSERAKVQRQ